MKTIAKTVKAPIGLYACPVSIQQTPVRCPKRGQESEQLAPNCGSRTNTDTYKLM